jgi:L-iditol 2-dehydrogenase
MLEAFLPRPGKVIIREVPKPKPGRGEALVAVKRIGVCGSDIHVWHGKHPYTSYPVIQGHELSGIIKEAGEGVELKVGQKVTVQPQVVCGTCAPCRRGGLSRLRELEGDGISDGRRCERILEG